MSNTMCMGSEPPLKVCGSLGWGKLHCDHNQDAGVICSGNLQKNITLQKMTVILTVKKKLSKCYSKNLLNALLDIPKFFFFLQ